MAGNITKMKGTIKKIHPIKHSRNGNQFIRVEFTMEDGSWAKTDLCPNFRNYQNWTAFLKEGKTLKDLIMTRAGNINADSRPDLFVAKRSGHWERFPSGNMGWVDDAIQVKPLEKSNLIQEKLIK